MHAMQGFRFGLAAFAAAGMLSTAAWAQSGSSSGNSSGNSSSGNSGSSSGATANSSNSSAGESAQGSGKHHQGQGQKAPEGYVLIEEDVIALTANEPQNHFLRAEQYLGANDPHAAAAEVRIAAAYLDMQASRDQGQESSQSNQSNQGSQKSESLSAAAKNLRQVAHQLQQDQYGKSEQSGQPAQSGQSGQASKSGSQQPTQEQQRLTKAFAEADDALANHFQSLAEQEINGKKAIRAGHDLDAAASSFQSALAWSGKQPPQDAVKAIADARRVSMELLLPQGASAQSPQAGYQSQASNGNRGNNANGQSPEEAQPAAARISGSGSDSGSHNNGNNGRIPDDASKVVKELGSAIQTCCQVGESGQGSSGQGNSAQSSHASGSGNSSSGNSGSGSSNSSSGSGSSSGQK